MEGQRPKVRHDRREVSTETGPGSWGGPQVFCFSNFPQISRCYALGEVLILCTIAWKPPKHALSGPSCCLYLTVEETEAQRG